MNPTLPIRQIAFIGNHSPRRCGLATFTSDICGAIANEYPEARCFAAAINDRPEGYNYPPQVHFEIDQDDPRSYLRAADFLHMNNVEVVSVQHEFGIYGGDAGSMLLGLLDNLRPPVVTTLHTVLQAPDPAQLEVMKRLDHLSDRFIVMADRARHLLTEVYQVNPQKIDLIPHGVIDLPFVDSDFYKDLFDAEGKTVLLTFGLLSPNKGIETVIEALPEILAQHPDVVYLVVGATHPNLLAESGESYRESLVSLTDQLGISDQVQFHNRFVPLEQLKEFIGAADIYLTPYHNEEQVTSGTLAYSFGAGKAIISTPYWHATELLSDGRGVLVPFADSRSIASAVHDLLANPTQMTALRKRAWKEGRSMIWPEVARRYMQSFEQARTSLSERGQTTLRHAVHGPIPQPNLEHLIRMSDHTGIFQHAIHGVPNYHEAYCTDDNARAFIYTVFHEKEHGHDQVIKRLACSYLAFLWHAFDSKTRRFRNFMDFSRNWLESEGSEDSHARALWAVGTALGHSDNDGFRRISALLFQRALGSVAQFSSPRAWAFSLIAIHEYLHSFAGDRVATTMRECLVARLVHLFHSNSRPDWLWFEDIATYDNAKLPHALIVSEEPEAVEIGLASLRWLIDNQTAEDGHFSPIGCHGFWPRNERPARFDQQPIEAHATISACMAAFDLTGEAVWFSDAQRCFEWFLGRNDLGLPLYDAESGGCRDALLQDHLNENQGAESTLAFHLSRSEITRRSCLDSFTEDLTAPALPHTSCIL